MNRPPDIRLVDPPQSAFWLVMSAMLMILGVFLCNNAVAATLEVGAGKQYPLPSAADEMLTYHGNQKYVAAEDAEELPLNSFHFFRIA